MGNPIGTLAIPPQQLTWGNINAWEYQGAGKSYIQNNTEVNIGLSDFSIELFMTLSSYEAVSATNTNLLNKYDTGTNTGYLLELLTTGALKLSIGNGTASPTTFTTDVLGMTANTQLYLVITAVRTGSLTFYVNNTYFYEADISGSVAVNITNTNDLYVFNDGSTNVMYGLLHMFRFYNYAITSDDINALWNNGNPVICNINHFYKNASFTPAYSSDWSAGTDSWTGTNETVSGNNDGISDGTTSYDNCFKAYATATNATHYVRRFKGTSGRRGVLTFKYYIPSANTNVDGLKVELLGNTEATLISGTLTHSVKGTWTSVTIVANSLYHLQTYATKAGATTFVGANSATNDIIYLKDFVITAVGCTAQYDNNGIGTFSWQDFSANKHFILNETNDTAGAGVPVLVGSPQQQLVSLGTRTTDITSVPIYMGQPLGYILTGIIVRNKMSSDKTMTGFTATDNYSVAVVNGVSVRNNSPTLGVGIIGMDNYFPVVSSYELLETVGFINSNNYAFIATSSSAGDFAGGYEIIGIFTKTY